MTVVLDFERDPKQLDDMSLHPVEADASDLQTSLLRQDIHFVVNGIPILDHAPVSLLLLSFWAMEQIRALPVNRRLEFEIPEGSLRLQFEMEGEKVVVREHYVRTEATAEYRELLRAWEGFAKNAKSYLLTEIPNLANHPEVGSWFSE